MNFKYEDHEHFCANCGFPVWPRKKSHSGRYYCDSKPCRREYRIRNTLEAKVEYLEAENRDLKKRLARVDPLFVV